MVAFQFIDTEHAQTSQYRMVEVSPNHGQHERGARVPNHAFFIYESAIVFVWQVHVQVVGCGSLGAKHSASNFSSMFSCFSCKRFKMRLCCVLTVFLVAEVFLVNAHLSSILRPFQSLLGWNAKPKNETSATENRVATKTEVEAQVRSVVPRVSSAVFRDFLRIDRLDLNCIGIFSCQTLSPITAVTAAERVL